MGELSGGEVVGQRLRTPEPNNPQRGASLFRRATGYLRSRSHYGGGPKSVSVSTDSKSQAIDETVPQLARRNELTDAGFTEVEQGLYEQGPFLIQYTQEGQLRLFTDMLKRPGIGSLSLRPDEEVRAVRVGKSKYSDPSVLEVIISNEKERRVQDVHPGSGSGGSRPLTVDDALRFVDTANKSLDEQLTTAGFTEEPQLRGLFKRVFESRFGDQTSQTEVLAQVKNGRLERMVREWGDSLSGVELVKRMGYKVTSYKELGGISPTSVLNAENDAMTFNISVDGDIGSVVLKREITPGELRMDPLETEERDGFIIGGVNSTDRIRQLAAINGQKISQLETRMKPALGKGFKPTGGISNAGFLGKEERLADVMAQDNDFVLSQGLTHQDLGRQLRYVQELYRALGVREFTYRGIKFSLGVVGYRGYQESPFEDGTTSSSDMEITNLITGESLQASLLLGHMIERYGFYEGHDTPYRVEPEQIIKVFGLASQGSPPVSN